MPHQTVYWIDWSIPEDQFNLIVSALLTTENPELLAIANQLVKRARPIGQYIGDPLPTRQDAPFEDLPL